MLSFAVPTKARSRLLVEASIVLAASRGNAIAILKDAATAYKVDTEAIAARVKQELAAKERLRRRHNPPRRS